MLNTDMRASPCRAERRHLILIADDEVEIFEIIAAYLQRAGMDVVHARDGIEALKEHALRRPDLVLLDVQMPQLDGWKVLAEIRSKASTPVIMLTAMDQDIDKLTGLRIGADDYVVKPFNAVEVVERVKAVLRRSAPAPVTGEATVFRVGDLEVDVANYTAAVVVGKYRQSLMLTLTEFKLIERMARYPNKVFTRTELMETCLPVGDALERTVDSHVSKLRRKLEDAGLDDIPTTVRGVGYRWTSSL